jgi:hypothetical protein
MTKDEALRFALEALQSGVKTQFGRLDWIEYDIELVEQAITAIKAALEAKDKPVSQPKVRTGNCLRVGVCASEGHKIPPQRTWVGLTDEETNLLWENTDNTDSWELIKKVEAKLKEKNT